MTDYAPMCQGATYSRPRLWLPAPVADPGAMEWATGADAAARRYVACGDGVMPLPDSPMARIGVVTPVTPIPPSDGES